jgi:hypothetical protein
MKKRENRHIFWRILKTPEKTVSFKAAEKHSFFNPIKAGKRPNFPNFK